MLAAPQRRLAAQSIIGFPVRIEPAARFPLLFPLLSLKHDTLFRAAYFLSHIQSCKKQ